MTRLLLILAFLASSNPTFVPQLYQTKAEVVAAIGLPKSIFSTGWGRYMPYELDRADGYSSGPGAEIYQRTYGGVSYEMRVFYGVDGGISGMTRPERIRGVALSPHAPLQFRNALATVPWLKSLCADGCEELRVMTAESYFVYLYKKPASPPNLDASVEAMLAAPAVQCVRISFSTLSTTGNGPLPSFDSLRIDLVELALTHPDIERKLSGGAFIVSDWSPAP